MRAKKVWYLWLEILHLCPDRPLCSSPTNVKVTLGEVFKRDKKVCVRQTITVLVRVKICDTGRIQLRCICLLTFTRS